MKRSHWLLILFVSYSLSGCSNKADFYIKNASFSNREIATKITIDDKVIMYDTLKYDSSEYGALLLQKELTEGNHRIEINLPGKAMSKVENINIDRRKKFIFITILDNASAENYRMGDLKISISVLNKKPH